MREGLSGKPYPLREKMETLGQKLKAARLKRKMTASEAAKATRIKIQHIEALERDDFSSIAAAAYAKGFIRIYAEYLGINATPLVEEYMEKHAPTDRAPLLAETTASHRPPPREPAKKSATPEPPSQDEPPKISIPESRSFEWPTIKWPAFKRPDLSKWKGKINLPSVPPRLLAIYTVVLMFVLLLVFTISRRGSAPDAPAPTAELPVVAPVSVTPSKQLPVPETLPEPYLD